MAIIGKIREKSWLVLIVVGAALVTFIFTSQGPNNSGPNEEIYGFGTIYGEKVESDEWSKKLSETRELNMIMAQRQQQEPQKIDENNEWRTLVQNRIMQKEYDALGIRVEEDEFTSYLFGEDGFPVMQNLAQNFADEAGNFDKKKLQKFIDDMENSEKVEDQKYWEINKKSIIDQRLREKYFSVLSQGVYVTKLESKAEYYGKNEVKNVSYVFKNYNIIEVDEASDEQLKAYFEKHKDRAEYETKISQRELRFTDIKVEPSDVDRQNFDSRLAELTENFKTSTDDSAYVVKNSKYKFYTSQAFYYKASSSYHDMNKQRGYPTMEYPDAMDSVFAKAQVGDVIGPYSDRQGMSIAKVVEKGPLLSVRHILISAQRTDTVGVEKAQKTTDSLMAIVNTDNFEELVKKHSQDQAESVAAGGKYEDFAKGQMVPEFTDFALDNPIGKIGYVQTDYGFHIIEVLDRKENAAPKLAIVMDFLEPSTETIKAKKNDAYQLLKDIYNKVDKIADAPKKLEEFDTLVKKAELIVRTIRIIDNAPKINEITSDYAQQELFKLAYANEAKVGDIISSPIKDGQRWVVAIVSAINTKGNTDFASVRSIVERDYLRDKKFEEMKKKFKGKSLETIAKENNDIIVQNENVTFNLPNLAQAYEPEAFGAIFSGLGDKKMTKAIKGKSGVYVIRIESTTKAVDPANYDVERDQMLATKRGAVQQAAISSLLEKAEVVDNRKFRQIGLRY